MGNQRDQIRRQLVHSWRKHQQGQPLEPLEHVLAEVIVLHPEYHALLDDPETVNREFPPEASQTNPFLHLGLHISIREQLMGDRPAGVLSIYRRLCRRLGDPHRAEHEMMQCLGETLWEAQRAGAPADESAYLRRLRQRTQRN